MLIEKNHSKTRYVSQSRIVVRKGISRISKLFIHRNENCRNSTPFDSKWNVYTFNTTNKLTEIIHFALNSRLSKCVVILYCVKKCRNAPKGVGLHNFHLLSV
uniref:Uncharacterized protein n=1 Tax=Meloidogyne incognita TaxID=6306 RepID=A0A914KI71_MELIC